LKWQTWARHTANSSHRFAIPTEIRLETLCSSISCILSGSTRWQLNAFIWCEEICDV
jgi:hypothetical protein